MRLFLFFLCVGLSSSLFASDLADQIDWEYGRLVSWAEQAEPDGEVGGIYPYVQFDSYKVMFSKDFDGKHEKIRFFMKGEDGHQDFAVTYIKSIYFEKGRTILRRFIGPEPHGWRMDQIDFDTKEYLGRQGVTSPEVSEAAHEILKKWDIQI